MTRVDFYILPGKEPNGRQLLACRLADKAYQLGRKVYIHTDSHAQTEQVDKLLWTFRQNSFVPHAVMDQAGNEPPPVLLGNG
ncbi:MAG: DNA polymerase III subunit chi, partial [Gammaproteobacteria bacterium]